MKKIISLILVLVVVFSISGCGKKVDVPVDEMMAAIKDAVKNEMIAEGASEENFKDGNLPGFMYIDLLKDEFNPEKDTFDADLIAEGYSLQHMMSVRSDLIMIIKVNDSKDIPSIKESLERIKEKQENIWSQYLQDQYKKVQDNIIKSNENYIIYITSDYPEIVENTFDSYFE